jgi:hypothetical protein
LLFCSRIDRNCTLLILICGRASSYSGRSVKCVYFWAIVQKKRCVYWANSSILAQMNTDISYRVSEVALVKLLAGPVSGWVGFRDFRGPVCTHKYRNSDRNISDPWIFIQWSRTSPEFFPKNPGDWDIASPLFLTPQSS